MRFLSSLFLTALYATATVNAQSDPPTQVHLAYAGKQQDGMTVSWATTTSQASTLCNYGTQQGGPYTFNATGSAPIQHKCFFYTSPYLHNVKLTGLTPNTKYYYVCGDQTNGLSAEGAFTSAAPVNPNGPYTMAIIGDLGQTKDSQSTVTNLVSNGAFGHVFIVGDLSYADMDGNRWDSWGKMMTPLTTQWALMSTAGNHEEEILCTGGTFAAYIARMNMPYQESGSTSNMWYSYEVANLHIISFSSYSSYDENSAQYAWIQQDLQKIDRTRTPWVVVMQHTPWYNSNQHHQGEGDDIQQTYEQMFYNAGVDLVFSGHVHAYERSKKVYNQNEDAKGIIHITIGDGGNREGLAEPWNDPQPDWSAFRQAAFGYGMLTTANATHALWEWHRDEDDIKIITDSVWIVKGQLNVVENYRPMIMPQTQWKKWNSAMW